MTSSSTRKNASSAFQPESSWASLYPVEESKQIQPRSELCHNWISQRTSTNTKINRMRGGSKPLYLPVGRKGATPLSPPSVHRTLRVDGCRHGRTRGNKSHIGNKPCPGRAKHRRTNAIVHCSNPSSCQRSTRRRAGNGRTQIPPSKAGLLCVHCPHPMQITVPTLSKDCICGIHGIPEATTLLSRVLNHSSIGSTTQRYYKQP